MRKYRYFLRKASLPIALAAGLSVSGCAEPSSFGGLEIQFNDDQLAVVRDGTVVVNLLGVTAHQFEATPTIRWGFFNFETEDKKDIELELRRNGNEFELYDDSDKVGRVHSGQSLAGNPQIRLEMTDGDYRSISLRFACGSDDRFWGLGEQYNRVDARGVTIPMWTQEQGVGRFEGGQGPSGSFEMSYFPMPYFMDPAKGFGVLVDAMTYSEFDACDSVATEWRTEVWDADSFNVTVFRGDSPGGVVQSLTDEVGKPARVPPDWVFDGVWIAAQGGDEAVDDRVQEAIAADIPISAVWSQDWLGQRDFGGENFGVKYRWIQDTELYPNLQANIAKWADQGVRFLGYFNPFVVPDFEHYEEAAQKSYVIQHPDGGPYDFNIITFPGSLLDITKPAAKEWFQGFAQTAVDLGMRGWMADFGEWVPYDAILDGGLGKDIHNDYPRLWHIANKEILEKNYPDGDYVMLTRSGFTNEQSVAQVVWAGDQEANWESGDGISTVLAAGLSMGMSGIPYFTHDIAGFSGGPSTEELFYRWVEMGAFTPIMRTHDGLQKKENIYFGSSTQVTAHFVAFSKIHELLSPYIKLWANYAQQTGEPIIRHTAFVEPGVAKSYDAHNQWFIGEDLVVAPVVTEGANSVAVFLPDGSWEHVLTGEVWAGPLSLQVDAPIGTPAVYRRLSEYAGSVSGATEALANAIGPIREVVAEYLR